MVAAQPATLLACVLACVPCLTGLPFDASSDVGRTIANRLRNLLTGIAVELELRAAEGVIRAINFMLSWFSASQPFLLILLPPLTSSRGVTT